MDGARLPLAAAALKIGLEDLTVEAEVDAVSLSFSKCGGFGGSAVIFRESRHVAGFKRMQKRGLSLVDKTWMLAAQANALLGTDLWYKTALLTNQREL